MSEGAEDEASKETPPHVKDDVVRKREFRRAQGVD